MPYVQESDKNCVALKCKPTFIIFVITFMHGIYNYMPETNRVCRVYSEAAVLYLQFVLHVTALRRVKCVLYFTLALSAVCMQCPIRLVFFLYFFNFLLSWCVAKVLSE
jgi:hypothetical protein